MQPVPKHHCFFLVQFYDRGSLVKKQFVWHMLQIFSKKDEFSRWLGNPAKNLSHSEHFHYRRYVENIFLLATISTKFEAVDSQSFPEEQQQMFRKLLLFCFFTPSETKFDFVKMSAGESIANIDCT